MATAKKIAKKAKPAARPKPKKAAARKERAPKPASAQAEMKSLQKRLQSEFSHAVTSAKDYVSNPERLRQLVSEAAKKSASLPKEQFKETWAYLQAMLRLIRAYYRGEYREIPVTTLLIIIAALIYLMNPLDFLPDWIPGLGLLDDAVILAIAVRQSRKALDEFMSWETSTS
jgi:uncharacterized membrane protein YkvA (DUF1232 family)